MKQIKLLKKKEIKLPEDTYSIYIARDRQDALRLNHADDLCDILWEFLYQDLRGKLKHGHEFKTADEALVWVRETLTNSLSNHNINIESLGS